MNKQREENKVSRDELLLYAAGELSGEREAAVRRAVRESRLLSREVARIQALLDAPARLAEPRPAAVTLATLHSAARQGRGRRVPLLERLGGVLVARRSIAAAVGLALLIAAGLYFGQRSETPTPMPVPVVDYTALEIEAGFHALEMKLAAVERLPSVASVTEPEDSWTSDSTDFDLRIEDLHETLESLAEEMDTV